MSKRTKRTEKSVPNFGCYANAQESKKPKKEKRDYTNLFYFAVLGADGALHILGRDSPGNKDSGSASASGDDPNGNGNNNINIDANTNTSNTRRKRRKSARGYNQINIVECYPTKSYSYR